MDAERAMQMQMRSAEQSGAQTARAPSPDNSYIGQQQQPATSRGGQSEGWQQGLGEGGRQRPATSAGVGGAHVGHGGGQESGAGGRVGGGAPSSTFMTAFDDDFLSGLTPRSHPKTLNAKP